MSGLTERAWDNEIQTVMSWDDIEILAESKCHLAPWSAAAKQPWEKKSTEKEDEWTKALAGIPADGESEAKKTDRLQGGSERPSCLCLVPLAPFCYGWKTIVWHLAPGGPGCYKPRVKCDVFCRGCALRLLLLSGCGGIRAGIRGSTVHPKESRFHILEWNAFWHCSASPWFE